MNRRILHFKPSISARVASLLLVTVVTFLATGCGSTGEYLWGWEEKKAYLAKRQAELDALQERTSELEFEMMALMGQLDKANADLKQARDADAVTAQQSASQEAEIREARAKAKRLLDEANAKKAELEKMMQAEVTAKDRIALEEEAQAQLRDEIAQLEKERAFLEQAAKETLATQADLLEEREGM